MANYDANAIKVLEGLEAVRLRPGMYIGSTNAKGLHHLIWEIIDNSIDEHLEGTCTEISVTVNKDGSISVSDNGRGIPVGLHEKGISSARIIFTILHAGGKFDGGSYKVSGGLHGVGASVVNALSTFLEVEVYQGGKVYRDRYENGGKPVVELKGGLLPVVGKTDKTGTKITFMPDETIFETIEFKGEIIKRRLKELAFLNKNLKINYSDERIDEEIVFEEKEGIVGFIKDVNKNKDKLIEDVIYVNGLSNDIEVEISIQYIKDFSETIMSFCNNINTIEGGNHVSGFKTALTRIVNQYAKGHGILKEKDENFEGRDVRNGLTAIISVKHRNPQFEGQTKTKLGNTDVRGAVDEVLAQEITKYFDGNIDVLKEIIESALRSQRLRRAEETARTKFLGKSAGLTTNGKLASCRTKNPEEAEIYLVEGDSAGGSAKQGRNRFFQAILPLKGKILNVEKQNIDAIVKSTEIASLITALGCGFGEGFGDDFDISKLNYHKIVIMTDADVDGAHIRTLLLTFFYRYMPELIYQGKVYIAMPPLYKVSKGKKEIYAYDDNGLADAIDELGENYTIQRYKGLGEMNPEQLWETTLNPKTRYFKRVGISASVGADDVTTVLMGSKVPPRKDFIYQEAINADLDI